MSKIVDFSLDNRFLVVILWLLVVGVGFNSLTKLPIDAVPDVTNIQVQILTNSPGLPPEEVERFVTFPVETAMSGLPAIEEIRSVSKFGLSAVTVVFEEGTDIYWARQLVGERLVEAREQIPEGYGEPSMGPISTGLGEIYQFEVRGENHTPMELRTILDWYVNYQLRSVPGVVEINAFGGELKTYQVTLKPDRLAALDIPVGDVLDALRNNNRNVGGGYIEHHGEQYLIRGEGLIETPSKTCTTTCSWWCRTISTSIASCSRGERGIRCDSPASGTPTPCFVNRYGIVSMLRNVASNGVDPSRRSEPCFQRSWISIGCWSDRWASAARMTNGSMN